MPNNQTHNMNIMFQALQLADIPKLIAECPHTWYSQTLCKVNDSIVRLGVFKEGEFHWHKHDHEDEFFFVIQGALHIEFESETVVLELHQGLTVPKGVMHRPFVTQPTAVMMVEPGTVRPTGDF